MHDDPLRSRVRSAGRRGFMQKAAVGTGSAAAGLLAGCLGGGADPVQAQDPAQSVPEPRVTLSTGVTLHYQSEGSGPPVVFIPGWTCTLDFFQKQVDALKSRYRVIRFDPRGHGQSEKTAEGHNFTQRGRDLAAFIDALGLDKVTLVGWSYGEYEALAYLRDVGPGKLAGMVLLDQPPRSPYDPADTSAWGEAAVTSDVSNASAVGGFVRAVIDSRTAFWTAYAKYMLHKADDTPDTDPEVAQIVAWGLQTPQSVATQMIADGLFSDFSEAARSLEGRLPTLVFARDDWGTAPVTWLAANLPSARLVRIVSHMGFWVDPDTFNAALLSFLDALPR